MSKARKHKYIGPPKCKVPMSAKQYKAIIKTQKAEIAELKSRLHALELKEEKRDPTVSVKEQVVIVAAEQEPLENEEEEEFTEPDSDVSYASDASD